MTVRIRLGNCNGQRERYRPVIDPPVVAPVEEMYRFRGLENGRKTWPHISLAM